MVARWARQKDQGNLKQGTNTNTSMLRIGRVRAIWWVGIVGELQVSSYSVFNKQETDHRPSSVQSPFCQVLRSAFLVHSGAHRHLNIQINGMGLWFPIGYEYTGRRILLLFQPQIQVPEHKEGLVPAIF